MSDTGIFAGLHQQISVCADLIDDVLVYMDSADGEHSKELQQQLGNKLFEIIDPDKKEVLSLKIIAMLLDDADSVSMKELAKAASVLQTGQIDITTRDVLERVAQVLDQERTKALARMRGSRR